ncbi:ribonuclease Y [Intestinibacillus massiliensis]|uniref:ribonuclease Y n=1 Tax=Intestinibacillus massiliensis TaxID=1871029 RepID=UPI000B3553F2|nr:ribonuclease Y [Intestinibacillus massiliensis]MCB6365340.1 ribonuclease Y [Intestinibacillus massiliensis]
MHIVIPIITAVVGIIVGAVIGFLYRKTVAEKEIGSAEQEATRIINDAIKSGETKKREAILEAKDEIHKSRTEAEREIKERRNETQKLERRLIQREEALDKKSDAVEQKAEELDRRLAKVQKTQEESEEVRAKQIAELERISGFSRDEAKEYLVSTIEREAQHDAAVKLREIMQKAKDEADANARELISIAIQRCAADHVAEATVSVVPLPNDEMKGRIIGREGRNIRTLETLTGVDLIIDDTPEAITLSSFDPVRREVARMTLEKLIADGRIHPARIEEMVEKSRKEIEQIMKAEGERATFEVGIHNLHPELVKLLGRLRYRTSYGQNVLKHSIEVAHVAGILAAELGLDPVPARRAGLLHDIGKAVDHEVEGSHVSIGVDLAKRYKENPAIVHAIAAHHGDVEPESIIACLVQAADAISAARPGARRENLENYIKRLEKLEEIANTTTGVASSYAIQAGREIRIIVKPEQVSDDAMVLLSRDIAKHIEDELDYPGQIKINMIRETRVVEYAK